MDMPDNLNYIRDEIRRLEKKLLELEEDSVKKSSNIDGESYANKDPYDRMLLNEKILAELVRSRQEALLLSSHPLGGVNVKDLERIIREVLKSEYLKEKGNQPSGNKKLVINKSKSSFGTVRGGSLSGKYRKKPTVKLVRNASAPIKPTRKPTVKIVRNASVPVKSTKKPTVKIVRSGTPYLNSNNKVLVKPLIAKSSDFKVGAVGAVPSSSVKAKIDIKPWVVSLFVFMAFSVIFGALYYKSKKNERIGVLRREYELKQAVVGVEEVNAEIQFVVSRIVKRHAGKVSSIKSSIISNACFVMEVSEKELFRILEPPAVVKPKSSKRKKAKPVKKIVNVLASKPKLEENPYDIPAVVGGALPLPVAESGFGLNKHVASSNIVVATAVDAMPMDVVLKSSNNMMVELVKGAFLLLEESDNLISNAVSIGCESRGFYKKVKYANVTTYIIRISSDMGQMLVQLESMEYKIKELIKKVNLNATSIGVIRKEVERDRIDKLNSKLEEERVARWARLESMEISDADSCDVLVRESMKNFSYCRVIKDLNKKREEFRTEGGKKQLDIYVDRLVYLKKLHEFLIDQLNGDPFDWGWIDGGYPEDIIRATSYSVKLRGFSVAWENVSTRQYLILMNRYVNYKNKNAKIAKLAESAVGCAIFCYEYGAYEFADMYSDLAVEMLPYFVDDVGRLLQVPESVDDNDNYEVMEVDVFE